MKMDLKDELIRETGKAIQLTAKDLCLLAEKAKGIDPKTLKRISVLDPEDLLAAEPQTDSLELR